MRVEIDGGSEVTQGSTITIEAGSDIEFEITNIEPHSCASVRVQSITLSNTTDFSISPSNPRENIKPEDCRGEDELEFEVESTSTSCVTTTTEVIITSNLGVFSFYITVERSPIISVLGGSPLADVVNGTTTTTATNGTYFGVVEEGFTETRRFYIANTGGCPLTISSITSSLGEFTITTPVGPIPPSSYDIASGASFYFDVTFLAPAIAGTYTSTITIVNNDTTANPFTFNVSAEVFNFNIPGPGGITADFRLWLKSTRGVTSSASKVSEWKDLGSNGKDASQPISVNQPTYIDNEASNINFNPVIKFENDGASLEQFMYNSTNGFYTQDIFIVMIPDETITSTTSRRTIFSGVSTGAGGDITGVGYGDYSARYTNEVLSYSQGVNSSYGIAETSTTKTYANAGIINARNNVGATGMDLLFNSKVLTTTTVNSGSFANVGYTDPGPPPTVFGSKYWIGRNSKGSGSEFVSLKGRIAEIFTFAERVPDAGRQKIETYLAIKYGITLGSSTQAEKDYVNSAGTKIWDNSANAGYNYNIGGIGRDSISDLNQKQSKSLNETNEVTIGLGLIFPTNNANTNEFKKDGDFLVWGCNNAAYTSSGANTVTISAGVTTSLTRILRKWKIVESKEDVNGDVGNVFVSIPSNAFTGFSKLASEEYVLIVSDTENFANADIVDVIPLKSDGATSLQTWYDFDGTKFFTFGKAPKLDNEKRLVNIAAGDYLVGEYALNLNHENFTVSAWVRNIPSANTRTIMAKGSKMQLRLNGANKIEVMLDNDVTPRFTSDMILNDSKWHQITFVYDSGSIFLYVDGVLDKSIQNIEPPTPNYNRFSVGAVYIDKDNIINPFLGEIDEIYVWDLGLTEEQVRYLMNQEIEKVTGNMVNGKVLPKASASNEVTTIPWSDLKAYYDFNSFYGSTVEGLTDDRNFLRIKYLNKTKAIVDTQTAPLPYVSAADGEWGTAATWLNSAVQDLPNDIGLDGLTYVDWNIVETTHNITSGDRDITVLALKNNSGKITIADPTVTSPIENNDGQGLRVTHYLELDGVIDLVGESQLVQDEGSILDNDSGGYIERDQQGTASSYNFNYWSSSVGPISGSTVARGTGVTSTNESHSISGVLMDGTDSSALQSITFSASYNAADTGTINPITLSTYWIYKFNGLNDDYDSWVSLDQNSVILPGEGYIMKGVSGSKAITENQNYTFKGKPNNGTITLPISVGNDRLIGNPYPSAIDANDFILDNIKEIINEEEGRNTVNVFNGALYFWHHFGQENSHNLADYVGGYATYTLMGGVQAYSTDALINATGAPGNKVPERYIPVNQGFFVSAVLDAALDSTTTTIDGGNIVFKNSQRVFERERYTGTNDGSLFFKTSQGSKNKTTNTITDTRPKIRLNFSSDSGYNRQLLVGIDKNTTNKFDIGYDAPIADIGKDDMFWVFNNSKFVIQAVNNFDNDQKLPLGIILEKDGLISIKMDELENIDSSLKVYIKDNETNEIYQINNNPFELDLIAGEYLDRFGLIFKTNVIEAEEADLNIEGDNLIEEIQVFMNNKTSELQIKKTVDAEIIAITLFNDLGQIVNSWKGNFNEIEFSIPVKQQIGVYIVQITTIESHTSKKIIIN